MLTPYVVDAGLADGVTSPYHSGRVAQPS
jgi:hypothetical protein